MRLREHRAVHAKRHSVRWRLPATGAIFALVVGAACWAPLAPTVLAPTGPAPEQPTPVFSGVSVPAVIAALPAPAVVVVPTVAPIQLPAPTPVVVPTLTASGQAMLAGIKSDRTAQWVKNHTETPLRSGPTEDSTVFTRLPQWTLLKEIESRPDWLLVQYSGDGDTRQAGPGWVRASDVGAVGAPAIWLGAAQAGTVWSTADASASRVVDVPRGTLMEVLTGPGFIQGTRVRVRLPGNGRSVPPTQGWVDG